MDRPALYRRSSPTLQLSLGCVNLASWPPLAAGREFTQLRIQLIAQLCTLFWNLFLGIAPYWKKILKPRYSVGLHAASSDRYANSAFDC